MKPGNLKSVMAISALAAVCAATMLFAKNQSAESNTAPSHQPAPEWQFKTLDGKTIRSSDFKGKVVILDFWATWCPPCREEIPGFIALRQEYAKKGLVVIGVSEDQDGPDVVKKFMKELGMNYTVVMADDKTVKTFGEIEALPTTFIIDRNGQIVKQHVGGADKDDFEKEIKPLLNP
ncbi:MAG TPA: redoxin domain-containing protein [Verrucomicrobiae bacterium]|jgi:DsbE subfamily thiol:disulfide oxidoreductase